MYRRLGPVLLFHFLASTSLLGASATASAAAATMDSSATFLSERPIFVKDCIKMATKEGVYAFRKQPDTGVANCTLMLLAPYNHFIQLVFNNLDINCEEEEDYITAIDGWIDGNGEMFPGEREHAREPDERDSFVCEENFAFHSSQNVAMFEYQLATPGAGFTVQVTFHKLKSVCNSVMTAEAQVETLVRLRNGHKANNCSILILHPVRVTIVMSKMRAKKRKDVLAKLLEERSRQKRCRDSMDYLEILGGSGFEPSFMKSMTKVCQSLPDFQSLSADEDQRTVEVHCPYTVVRLVSSGRYNISVMVRFERFENKNDYSDSTCGEAD